MYPVYTVVLWVPLKTNGKVGWLRHHAQNTPVLPSSWISATAALHALHLSIPPT